MRYAIWLLVTITGILFLLMGSSLQAPLEASESPDPREPLTGQAQEGMIFKDKALHKRVVKVIDALEDEALGKKFLKAMEIIDDAAAVSELLKFWEKKGIDLWNVDVPLLMKVEDRTVQKVTELFSDEELKKLTKDVKILFKWASVAPEGSIWYERAHKSLIELEELTDGHVSFKLYGGGMMGDEADTVRKMRMKQLHMLGLTTMGFSMLIPEMCVLELPFLFDWEPDLYYNSKCCQIDYILEKLKPALAKLGQERGVFIWGVLDTCVNFFSSQVPLKKVEDFQALMFFVWREDRIRPALNKAFAFRRTVSGGIFDVASMLSTGMINCAFGGWYMHVILQWWPHIKYITDYPLYGFESATNVMDWRVYDRMVNLIDKWGALLGFKDTPDIVGRVMRLAEERSGTLMRLVMRQQESRTRKELIRRGTVEEVHFPEEELERLREKITPLYYELADKKYPRWLLDEILKYRQEYRALKASGKLTNDWYERGILPGGVQKQEWMPPITPAGIEVVDKVALPLDIEIFKDFGLWMRPGSPPTSEVIGK